MTPTITTPEHTRSNVHSHSSTRSEHEETQTLPPRPVKLSCCNCCQSPFESEKNAGSRQILELSDNVRTILKQRIYGCNQPASGCARSLFPLFAVLTRYKWKWVWNDFASGIIVSMIHLPQAMAGAMTAVMKPQHGLFMTIIPVVIYALLGSSPQNSNGGMPVTAALFGVSLAKLREGHHPDNYTMLNADQMLEMHYQIAGSVAFFAGIFQILMGLCKFGFLSNLLSSNVLDPFSVACCLQAICGQVPVMLGIKLFPYCGLSKHPWLVVNMVANMDFGVNGFDTAISAVSASVILGFREFLQPAVFRRLKLIIPIEFLVLVIATTLSYLFDFRQRFGVRTLGSVPESFPTPKLPSMEYAPDVLLEGLINGFVSFGITLTGAKIIARKDGDRISPNQELIAVGSSNLIGSLFSCFVAAAPVGRSVINHSMGSKSQLSSIFGALFMCTLFLTAGQSLKYLPVCVVSTNIVVTLLMTMKMFADIPKLWRNSRLDAGIWLSTFVGCILLDVRIGLFLGMGLSLFSVTYRTQRPKIRVLGRIVDSAGYVPIKYYKQAAEIVGLKILQMQCSLHYGNAEYLVKKAEAMAFTNNLTPKILPANAHPQTHTMFSELKRSKSFPDSASKLSLLSKTVRKVSHFLPPFVLQNESKVQIQMNDSQQADVPTDKSCKDLNVALAKDTNVSVVDDASTTFYSTDDVVHRVILDLSIVAFIDSVGLRALEQLGNDLKQADIELLLSQNKGSLLQKIKKINILKTIPERNIFLCVEDAVSEAVRRNVTATMPSRGTLQEPLDQHFWPTPVVRVEGLPGTNQTSSEDD